MPAESLARMNYASETEAAVNKQVNIELYASHVYLSMAAYFDRDDVALHNIAKFMMKSSDEEREHATGLMKFQTLRGGKVVLNDVQRPERSEWGSALEAFQPFRLIPKFRAKVDVQLVFTDLLAHQAGSYSFSWSKIAT